MLNDFSGDDHVELAEGRGTELFGVAFVHFVSALDKLPDGFSVVIKAVKVAGGLGDFGVEELAGVPFGKIAVIAAADIQDAFAGAEILDSFHAVDVESHNLADLDADAGG
jgi:hypothetical protein